MEVLPAFRLHRPASVEEAVELRHGDPDSRFVAGGTDLIVNVRRGIEAPGALIDLTGIDALRRIDTGNGALSLGAAVTLAELAAHPEVDEGWPVVAAAAREVAGSTHRQVATVGGNLCLDTRCVYYNQSEWWRRSNGYCLKDGGEVCYVAPGGERCWAAFSGDLAPTLLVLGATAEIAGPAGGRTIPLAEMYADDGVAHLRLDDGELLTCVRVPAPNGARAGYEKARVRGAIDFPLAGVAIALKRKGGKLADLRCALTGTDPCPILVEGTGALAGAGMNDDTLRRLHKLVERSIQPMQSTFTGSQYRRRVAANLAVRLAERLFA